MKLTKENLKLALSRIQHPVDGSDFMQTAEIGTIEQNENIVSVELKLGYPMNSIAEELRDLIITEIRKTERSKQINIQFCSDIVAHATQANMELLPDIKNIIAVASGKGGVGKSTTAVNLALALAKEGAEVGLLDADIYGPSQQRMLGLTGRPQSPDGKKIEPMVKFGLQAMSISMLVEEDKPLVLRGPMISKYLEQLLRDTQWRNLDYLVVDLPPGTGDIQLTLSQKVPLTGAIIVTTPQDIALIDAKKALKMFGMVGVPILGVMENMSTHICQKCGHEEAIFGSDGAEKMSRNYDVSLLGKLPLELGIRLQTDSGEPTVVSDPGGSIAIKYHQIALKIGLKISSLSKIRKNVFPKIVIKNS